MRTAGLRQTGISWARSFPMRRAFALLPALAMVGIVTALAAPALADQAAVPKGTANASTVARRAHKKAATTVPVTAVQVAPELVAPKPPDWPANDHPADANVVWNSHGLRIDAANSSLQQIFRDVSAATGTKVSGMVTDQRVFGTYGPGPARQVLAQLLDGSGYNVVMIGDLGQGTPRQIVLSRQPTGPAPPPGNDNNQSAEDNSSADVEEPQQPQPQPQEPPQQPQNPPPGFGQGGQPRTPQQILQEMQQRQLQIQQQQQQGTSPQP